jgi:hypothetical protein
MTQGVFVPLQNSIYNPILIQQLGKAKINKR